MKKQKISEEIVALVRKKAEGFSEVKPESDLENELGLDSLDLFEIFLDCEVIYDVVLGEGVDKVKTVQDLTDLVWKKLQS